MQFPTPIDIENLPDFPYSADSASSFEEALAIIRADTGGAPKRLYETRDGEPIAFDTHTKGKQSGFAYVNRKPDGWLITYGDVRSNERYNLFVWGASPGYTLLPASVQQDTGKAERAAQTAAEVWERARPAGADHPYLQRKQVKPTDTLREIRADELEGIIGYRPKADGAPLEGRILIVPVAVGDAISTVELIDEQGRKSALAGGRKSGGYWATGPLPDTGRIVIAEGVATALSIAEALGESVVAALSVNNLEKVGRALQCPGRKLAIAADLGEGGEPHKEAVKAAIALNARLYAPASDLGKGGDFNDLHVRDGLDAVRAVFTNPGVPEIIPEISDTLARLPYPVDALPGAIRSAVLDVQAYTQAPTALTAASALTAVSIAVQGLADVQPYAWLTRPVSLFLLTVASSGERKTTCDRFFTEPLREFEREKEEKSAFALKAYEAAMAAWSAKQRGLLKAIEASKRSEGGKAEAALSSKEAALTRLYEEMPEKPPVPRLLYSDATTEALAYSITHSWPTAGLVSSEAGTVFGGYSMGADTVVRNLAVLNQLWDGADFSVDRRTKESFSVRNVRLTVGLQVQPEVLYSFMDRHGALSRGQGFLARFLLAFPESTQGTRIFKSSPGATPGLEAFQRRLRELLEMPLPLKDKGDKAGGKLELDPPVITLTPGAFKAWTDYYNRTERRLKGDLQGLTDVGSKAAEQVARLAAVFQVFECGVTNVEAQYVEAAAQIVDWYLLEAKRIYCETNGAIDLSDATRLERWLQKYCRDKGIDYVACRDARRLGPVRDAKRFEQAIRDLEQRSVAWAQRDGMRHVLRVNPAFLRYNPTATLATLATLPVSDGKQGASNGITDATPLRHLATPEAAGQSDVAPGVAGVAGVASGVATGEAAQAAHSQQLQSGVAGVASVARGEGENSPTLTPASGAGGLDVDKRAADEQREAFRQKLAANKGKTVCLACGNVISECTCRRKPQDDNNPTIEAATEPSLPGVNGAGDARPCKACGEPMTFDPNDGWVCPSCEI